MLPIIKSRLGMIDADATPHDAQVTKSYATNPVQNPNYKESKDIFEQKFKKEIDRQLSPRPATGEEINPEIGKYDSKISQDQTLIIYVSYRPER